MKPLVFRSTLFMILSFVLLSSACESSLKTPVPATSGATEPQVTTVMEQTQTQTPAILEVDETQATALSLQGNYQVLGKNPDGSDYRCSLEILRDGEVYQWRWSDCGDFSGVGIEQGNVISVGWGSSECQVAAYQIQEDGSLSATWTSLETTSPAFEMASPTGSQGSLAGTYNLTGKSPDGSSYEGTLEIIDQNGVTRWVKETGVEMFGVGIQREDVISVVYGDTSCSVVSYLVHEDQSLDSLWAYVGDTALGSEVVTRLGAALPSDASPTIIAGAGQVGQTANTAPAQPSAGCGSQPAAQPGKTTTLRINVNGLERMYLLHLPINYDPQKPTSLVLNFHGYTDTAKGTELGTRMSDHADQYNYIVIYPNAKSFQSGTRLITSWNDLSCNASPGPEGPICSAIAMKYPFPSDCGEDVSRECNWCTCSDDLGFVEKILDEAEANLCVDVNRVYATGMSNGGMFVHRLGCNLANRFAAIAPVSGTLARGFNCAPDPSNPISMLNIHGREDDYVDVTGKESSDGYFYTAIDDVMALWASPASQACDQAITPYPTLADGISGMQCTQHANCATGAEVVSCWWDAGHSWPGGIIPFGNDMIWDFFVKHARQTPASESAGEITLLPAEKYQTLDGFGAAGAWWAQDVGGWEDEKRNEIVKLLFNQQEGIGLSIYRYNIGGGDNQFISDPWRRAETFEVSPGVYDWNRDQNALWILKAAREQGVDQFVAFANSPPARMTVSGRTSGHKDGKSNLPPEMYADFAQYLVDIVRHLRDVEGIPIGWISPFNEPQWNWSTKNGQEGCHYEPGEVLEVTRILLRKIQEDQLDVKVSVFESGEWKNSEAYISKLLNDPEVAPQLDHLAIHSYWSVTSDKIPVIDTLNRKYPGTKLWMSEWTEMKEGRDTSMNSALILANTVHEDLTLANVSSWQYWIAVSRYIYRDGLIYVNLDDRQIVETKRLWVMGNFSRFIRPGFSRIGIQSEISGLRVSAYQSPDQSQIVLVVINPSKEPIVAKLSNLPSGFAQVSLFETSSQYDLANVYQGELLETYSFPPESVTTLLVSP